jgi:hypothetical protein
MSFMKNKLILCALIFLCQPVYGKAVIGWVEKAAIHPGNFQLKAKIDSGAKSSSIHCDCQSTIKRNGEDWLRFTVTNDKGEQVTLERKILRTVKIKRHFGEKQQRPVIKLGICLKNIYKETEVNVIDRGGLNYQLLIGRDFLAGDFLIDTDARFTSNPDCNRK